MLQQDHISPVRALDEITVRCHRGLGTVLDVTGPIPCYYGPQAVTDELLQEIAECLGVTPTRVDPKPTFNRISSRFNISPDFLQQQRTRLIPLFQRIIYSGGEILTEA